MNLKLIRKYFEPQKILDIGANVGQFYHFAKEEFPNAEFFLIEGNEHCEAGLKPLNVPYKICLLSDENKVVDFYIRKSELRCTGNSIYKEKTHFFADDDIIIQETPTVKLDDLFEHERFDLIKIDTQGSEMDIIKGGLSVIQRANAVLMEVSVVEFNENGPLEPEINKFMDEIGFEPKEVIERLNHPETHTFIQKDVLFVKKNL